MRTMLALDDAALAHIVIGALASLRVRVGGGSSAWLSSWKSALPRPTP